ncbi:MAG TPA: thiamine pyrophosphate-dependent enzyme, partial [Roseiarcus sp.]|nr:thiamine pyrophosphate-dependent enzyme [Roseiarcus sp.]
PFFDAMETAHPGSGGLFSAVVDPWKCTGCLECVDICGPHALVAREQDEALVETLQTRFDFLSRLPNTPSRFVEGATAPDGDTKRLMLDRDNYYATTGGHGACRGCGEVTAIRLVTATNHDIHDRRRKDHMREVERLIDKLNFKLPAIEDTERDPNRRERVKDVIETLEKRLYFIESGPRGQGPASAVIANATGCSSVYASTFPFNPYNDPWVNSLFQDTPAVAKGVFEGLGAEAATDVKALRIAQLELEDAYDPEAHDRFFRTFSWADFTPEEMGLMPTVISMGGDGATYDIGFGALSRVLSTTTPIKVVVLNSGAYSNTGGQASTASLTAQDADLSRYGAAHHGKQDERKELALIAAFHPNVFVVQSCAALGAHFLKNVVEFINHNDSPAVLDVYTPCQGEQGIADPQASRHGRLAVVSRMNPVFVHDPRKGASLHERFSLEGNPDLDKDWATGTIEHVENGATKLLAVPMTPADFALTEGRFRKQFHRLPDDAAGVPVHEYVDLSPAEREGKTPFVWSTDDEKRLIKVKVSEDMIHLVRERRRNWRSLQVLAGLDVKKLDAEHHVELEALQAELKEATEARESSIDSIARAMSELAASSKAPPIAAFAPSGPVTRLIANAPAAPPAAAAAAGDGGAPLAYAEEDVEKCSNCKTCYQEIPELFEKTSIVVNGEAKEVGHLIAGALARVKVTPELKARIARVAANCDSEIIHER